MTAFTRGFRLHTADGRTLDGACFPSGRAVVLDDPEYGLASAATSVDELLKGYHGARVEWSPEALAVMEKHRQALEEKGADEAAGRADG